MIKPATLHKFTRILYLLNKLDKGRITLTQEAKELVFPYARCNAICAKSNAPVFRFPRWP